MVESRMVRSFLVIVDLRLGLAGLLLGFAGVGLSCRSVEEPEVDAARRRLPLQAYPIEGLGRTVLRGVLDVPEDRSRPEGRKIPLQVIVVAAESRAPKRAPLFHLAGGPGAAASHALGFYTQAPQYRERDVVLVDQRGSGESRPLLLARDPAELESYLDEPTAADLARGREVLERAADLTQYTTTESAEDLERVREWLGYETIDLLGVSYGSRLAQVYMRTYPGRVRCAVLYGAWSLDYRIPLQQPGAFQRSMDRLFDDCAEDPRCEGAFPDLRAEFEELLLGLSRTPGRQVVEHPHKAGPVDVTITRAAFLRKIREHIGWTGGRSIVPYVIHAAHGGDFLPLLRVSIPRDLDRPPTFAAGLYGCVTCTEDVPFIDPEEARAAAASTFLGLDPYAALVAACRGWPRGVVPEGFHKPIEVEVPTLILSGELDPLTPPELGAAIEAGLPNSLHAIVPGMAHVAAGLRNEAVLEDWIVSFLDRGSVQDLDPSDLDPLDPPPFVVDPFEFEAFARW